MLKFFRFKRTENMRLQAALLILWLLGWWASVPPHWVHHIKFPSKASHVHGHSHPEIPHSHDFAHHAGVAHHPPVPIANHGEEGHTETVDSTECVILSGWKPQSVFSCVTPPLELKPLVSSPKPLASALEAAQPLPRLRPQAAPRAPPMKA